MFFSIFKNLASKKNKNSFKAGGVTPHAPLLRYAPASSNWFRTNLYYLTKKIRWTETLYFYIIRQVPTAEIERFYQGILCHVKLQIPVISEHRIIRNQIGNDRILQSDLIGSYCIDLVGTHRIQSADFKGKCWITSESGKK